MSSSLPQNQQDEEDREQRRFTVTISPLGWTFETSDAHSLMAAARLARIALPASCRNGTCRTCICRLTAGSIRHGIEWPGLSAEEKRDGYILPCVAYAKSDVVIEVPLAKPLRRTGLDRLDGTKNYSL